MAPINQEYEGKGINIYNIDYKSLIYSEYLQNHIGTMRLIEQF